MKTTSKFSVLPFYLLISLLFATSSKVIAQNQSVALKDFKIIIEKTKTGIKMKGIEGSAWQELSFSLNNDQSQTITPYGMVDTHKIPVNNSTKFPDYIFTITKTDKGIELKGIKGTAWTNLSFSLTQKQAFNQYGMVEPD